MGQRLCHRKGSVVVSLILGLGSNLGERENNLKKAIKSIAQELDIIAVGVAIETKPVDYLSQPHFLNQSLECQLPTSTPEELLNSIKKIELNLGRQISFAKGPRVIDIDILFWGDLHYQSPTLSIPHPQVINRHFIFQTVKELPFFKEKITSHAEFSHYFQSIIHSQLNNSTTF